MRLGGHVALWGEKKCIKGIGGECIFKKFDGGRGRFGSG
jgi:hypothetical protein